MPALLPTPDKDNYTSIDTIRPLDTGDITVVCGECGGNGCRKCNHAGTVTIIER